MSEYIKAKEWNGEGLKGAWSITLKIDGVRAFFTDNGVFSRAGKPLYNMQHLWEEGVRGDFEVFVGGFKETIQATRSSNKFYKISKHNLYSLQPVDHRLSWGYFCYPDAGSIKDVLKMVVEYGAEGVILRQGDKWLKVKPFKSFDVPITAVIEGTGKYVGMLGAFMTDMGKVGTGFTDKDRKEYFSPDMVGKTIEVKCMELTKDGMFRHPVFMRIREDK